MLRRASDIRSNRNEKNFRHPQRSLTNNIHAITPKDTMRQASSFDPRQTLLNNRVTVFSIKQSFNQGIIKYGKNISWLLVEKIVRIIFGITIGAWVARHLGPSDFGLFNFAHSFVGLFAALSTLGLEDLLMREVLQDKKQKGTILGTACVLKTLGSFLLFLCVYLTIPFINTKEETHIIVFIFAASFFFRSFNVIDYYFRSEVLSRYIVFSNLASLIICSLIRIFLIINGKSLIYFAAVVFIDLALCALFYGIFYTWKENFFKDWKFDFLIAKKLLYNTWPLFLIGILTGIDIRIDQIMLNQMIGPEATGYYAAATRINESLFWLFEVFTIALFPAIINAKKENTQKYTARLEHFYTFMIIIFLISFLPLIFFSKNIIAILYGNQYALSADILKVNAACGFFIAMKCAQARWSIAENLQRYNLIIQIVSSLCNILLNFILIKKFGVMGAAYGTLLAHTIGVIVVTGMIKPMRPSLAMMAKGIFNIVTFRFIYWKSLLK